MKTQTVIPSLFPDTPAKPLSKRPARPAPAPAPPAEETPHAQFRPLVCKTLLNENPNPAHPFRWTINPYRGCEFGCSYCYARYTHKYIDPVDPAAFDSRIYVKFQAAAILAEQIKPEMLRNRPIAIGTATDPYQSAEKRFRITRSVLEVLSRCPGVDVSITTKSPLILRDIDILRKIQSVGRLVCHVSIATAHPTLSRILDRKAPTPRRRLETVRDLSAKGIEVGVFVMPILPGITDSPAELRALLRAARAAGARFAEAGVARLAGEAWASFEPILHAHFPDLVGPYRSLRDPSGSFLPRVTRPIENRFRQICVEAGLPPSAAEAPGRASRSAGSGWLFG